jgi:diguanylate cyclase (GGDEF)-like protein
VLRSIGLLAAWLLVWEVGYLVEYTKHVSVWFPVAGLTFAAFTVIGPTAAPALLVGCVVITFATRGDYNLPLSDLETLKAGLLFGAAHLVPYGVGAAILRLIVRKAGRDITRVVVAFLVIAAIACLLTASLVLPSLVLSNMMPAEDVGDAWLPFWVGDMAGVMALAPLFIGLLVKVLPGRLFDPVELPVGTYGRPSRRFVMVFGLMIAVLVGSMLLAMVTRQPNSAFAIFFLVIPHMWIACTESPLTNTLAVGFTSFLIAFLVHMFQLMDFVMVYQFAISVIAANTLFGLAVPTLIADNTTLRTVAYTDRLTQVASREQLERQAAVDIARGEAEGRPFSLLVFDVDRLKIINDTFGHQAGDAALRQVCDVVRQSLRPTDTLGRIGGDEFAVLLQHTTEDQADLIGVRIIHQLHKANVGGAGHDVSASIGVAERQPGEAYERLFARADAALYQAKLGGGSRVVRAFPSSARVK